MTTLRFSSPVAKPLYGFGGVEVIGGKIASPLRKRTLNDPATFEITQTAAQHVASGVGTGTPAIDIGNGSCGEPILAMLPGWASRVSDPKGALGVRIDHGPASSEYWHFDRFAIPSPGAYVQQGQVIGYLGSTGLGGVCHCHIEIKVHGTSIDPEPYVLLGAPLTIEEAGLAVTTTALNHIINRRCTLTVDANFRADATRQAEVLALYPGPRPPDKGGTIFVPTVEVTGEAIGTNARWLGGWMYRPDRGYAFGFFHSSVLSALEPIEQTDCTTQVAEATRTYEVRIDGIKGDAASIVPILERMAKR